MAKLEFKKATKKTARARVALSGPAGSGKTYTSLAIATNLGSRVAVIDTEHGSASKYAGIFDFEVLELESFSPETYVQAIEAAEEQGFDVIVIDSLSHAWMGKDGALEQVDRAAKKSSSGNSYTAWRDITPKHNALVEAMLACKAHLVVTMRTKTEYVLEENDKGKKVPKKVGLQPVQRDGLEYEFDVTGDLDLENNLFIGKTRCPELKGKMFTRAGADVADALKAWLSDGSAAPLTPVEEFLGRFRICGGAAEAKEIMEEIAKRKAEFSETDLARMKRVASATLDRFKGAAPAQNQGAPS